MNNPKVFISYSWTDQAHQELVKSWADRLIADGIEVILDIYDFKEGDDKNVFMESMVTDSTVTHVLVICDSKYSKKANSRKAGVGAESQIISGEVYAKVKHSKFIPIACSFDDEGEAILPIFMKSRKWINFSTPEAENENWEQLVRLIYGKPRHVKPVIGNIPSYIKSDTPLPTNEVLAKFNSLKQAVLQGRNGVSHYRRDFIESCMSYADALRVRENLICDNLGQKIIEDCSKLKAIRNYICSWVLFESEITEKEEFTNSVLDILERLRELRSRPIEIKSWNDSWFQSHEVFVYETFLYIIAALIKSSSCFTLREFYSSSYLLSSTENYGESKFAGFECFYGYSESLQSVLAPPGQKLHSPAAELLKRQADREDIPFIDIIQAELLTTLMAFLAPNGYWYPQTLHYAGYGSSYPFFVKAAQHKNFKNLSVITGIESADVLRARAKEGYERMGVKQWYNFNFSRSFWSLMNMDNLDTIK